MEMTRNNAWWYHLPTNVWPTHYKWSIKPNWESFNTFEGELWCRIKVNEPCNEILFHSVKLDIKHVELKTETNKLIKPEKILYDEEKEIVKLFFGTQRDIVPSGTAMLMVKYHGMINEHELKGLYVNRWDQEHRDSKDWWWLITKLDRFQARMVLPCWDEPHFKASFTFDIEIPKDWNCVFTSEKDHEELFGNGKKIHFKETPFMSISSLGFVAGKFDKIDERVVDSTKFRVWAPKWHQNSRVEFIHQMFEMATKIFDFYTKTWGKDFKYPIEKLDLMVVPNYAIEGTSSFGFVAVRDHWSIDNNFTTSWENWKKQKFFIHLAGHIIKQWFGHVVTVKDWQQIWFEKAMSHFLGYYAVDKIWPEWGVWEQRFNWDEFTQAVRFDGLPSTVPMEWTHETWKKWVGKVNVEQFENFKSGDYGYLEKFFRFSKGTTIIRMVRDYIGEHSFMKSLKNYLVKYHFKCPTADDLWVEMGVDSKKPLKHVIATWSKMNAFPIVHVNGNVDASGNFVITLKQESVLNHLKKWKTDQYYHEDEYKFWHIPMTFLTNPKDSNSKVEIFMDKETYSWTIPAAEYRANDDHYKNCDEFTTKLNKFVKFLLKDKRSLWSGNEHWWFQRPTFDTKHRNEEMLWGLLTHMLVVFKDDEIEHKAVDIFWQWYQKEYNSDKVEASKAIFAAAAQTNDMKVFNAFIKIYKEDKFEHAREYVIHGFGFFNNSLVVNKILEFAFEKDVQSEDRLRIFQSVAHRFPSCRDQTWKSIQEKFDFFFTHYDPWRFGVNFFQQFITETFADQKNAQLVGKFVQEKLSHGKHWKNEMFEQSIEYVRIKSEWFKRDGNEMKQYLKQF
ncbi:hypothetical protein BLOT_008999 [Blomia tropicalis]|nr:hypothetical protein BLOT_008999 [Blomia tropicalis]